MVTQEQTAHNSEARLSNLFEQYTDALSSIATSHAQGSDHIAQSYVGRVQEWLDTPEAVRNTEDFDTVLQIPGISVDEINDTALAGVLYIFEEKQQLEEALSPADRAVYGHAMRWASHHGVGHSLVKGELKAASSEEARAVMRAAMDGIAFERAMRWADSRGVFDSLVTQELKHVSSEEAQAAMRAAMDKITLERAMRWADSRGAFDSLVGLELKAASSEEARAAMRATIDSVVFKRVLRQANRGLDHSLVKRELKSASGEEARAAMRAAIVDRLQARERARYEYEFTGEDAFREARRRAHERRERENPYTQEPPKQEAPRQEKPKVDPEIEGIINAAITKDYEDRRAMGASMSGGVGWLERADRADVKRVVTTVRTLRKQAEEKGETISDTQIYLRYRRLIDPNDHSPQTETSFKILAALMGDKPKGKLPF